MDSTTGFFNGLYYEIAGEGHPLVLIHGGLVNSGLWDDQFEVFAGAIPHAALRRARLWPIEVAHGLLFQSRRSSETCWIFSVSSEPMCWVCRWAAGLRSTSRSPIPIGWRP